MTLPEGFFDSDFDVEKFVKHKFSMAIQEELKNQLEREEYLMLNGSRLISYYSLCTHHKHGDHVGIINAV